MEIICPGPKTSESEFQIVPATPSHPAAQLTAACGPNAAAAAARWASQSLASPTTLDVYRHMRSLGLGGSDGLSDLNELQQTLESMKYTVERPKAGETVQQFMDRMAGHAAVVWETNNGQVLRDQLTGMGEDATNLQRHILCLLGKKTDDGPSAQAGGKVLPVGYWCADGDNNSQNLKDGARYHWPINERLVYYAASDVVKAQPIDALAVHLKEAPVTNPTPTPLEISQWHELQADRAQIATLKQQLEASQAQSLKQYQEIVNLRSQIASLKQQIANAPKPDPVATALLAAVRAAATSAAK